MTKTVLVIDELENDDKSLKAVFIQCPACQKRIAIWSDNNGEPNSPIKIVRGKNGTAKLNPSFIVCMNDGCEFAGPVVLSGFD